MNRKLYKTHSFTNDGYYQFIMDKFLAIHSKSQNRNTPIYKKSKNANPPIISKYHATKESIRQIKSHSPQNKSKSFIPQIYKDNLSGIYDRYLNYKMKNSHIVYTSDYIEEKEFNFSKNASESFEENYGLDSGSESSMEFTYYQDELHQVLPSDINDENLSSDTIDLLLNDIGSISKCSLDNLNNLSFDFRDKTGVMNFNVDDVSEIEDSIKSRTSIHVFENLSHLKKYKRILSQRKQMKMINSGQNVLRLQSQVNSSRNIKNIKIKKGDLANLRSRASSLQRKKTLKKIMNEKKPSQKYTLNNIKENDGFDVMKFIQLKRQKNDNKTKEIDTQSKTLDNTITKVRQIVEVSTTKKSLKFQQIMSKNKIRDVPLVSQRRINSSVKTINIQSKIRFKLEDSLKTFKTLSKKPSKNKFKKLSSIQMRQKSPYYSNGVLKRKGCRLLKRGKNDSPLHSIGKRSEQKSINKFFIPKIFDKLSRSRFNSQLKGKNNKYCLNQKNKLRGIGLFQLQNISKYSEPISNIFKTNPITPIKTEQSSIRFSKLNMVSNSSSKRLWRKAHKNHLYQNSIKKNKIIPRSLSKPVFNLPHDLFGQNKSINSNILQIRSSQRIITLNI